MRENKKIFITLGGTLGGLTVILVVLTCLKLTLPAETCDAICLNVVQYFVAAAGFISSLFPFSIFEWWVVGMIIAAITLLTLGIIALVKKKYLQLICGLMTVAAAVLGIVTYYTFITGFAYYRSDVPVPQSTQKYDNESVTQAAVYFTNDYNELSDKMRRDASGNVISPYSAAQLSKLIAAEFDKTEGFFYDYSPKAKPIVNSYFMTLTDITGITFTPFGEPAYNRDVPASSIPTIVAHEFAHAKGVMREGDCNFTAYYILLGSDNDYLRYCGYFSVWHSILSAVDAYKTDKTNYTAILESLRPEIVKEQQNYSDFWLNKSNRPGIAGALSRFGKNIGKFFNDLYLRISGADNGTDSYYDNVIDGGIIDTGTVDPDTDEPIWEIHYSSIHKLFFYLYEKNATNLTTT